MLGFIASSVAVAVAVLVPLSCSDPAPVDNGGPTTTACNGGVPTTTVYNGAGEPTTTVYNGEPTSNGQP